MKTVKNILLTLILLGSMASCSSQTRVVRVYPAHGTVVTTIHNPKVVVHKKTNFYFANGVWYKARGRKYVVSAAPVGVRLRTLPRGYRIVRVNGRKLYKYKGVWYKKSGRNFVVVTV
ncbi:DUF6515 family protein [Flagellimonas allohymeniacidonis]|uniref:Uncharacterized protein n=1 Tax=Flagellimonas allohymeniacidonis TaxID=2517819 RepID=A0A4Q8QFC2_9FLAO|nr:DUF6515 family protein [Allomuricauda hymeniacidonis]TAI49185.1 hypothetical protein EW142_05145 [Allomuricauda hymeniacidonis]